MNLAYQYKIPFFTVGQRLWAQFTTSAGTKACFKVCKVLEIREAEYYVILLNMKKQVRKWMLKVDAYPYLDAPHPPTEEEVDFRYKHNWNAEGELDREALEAYRKKKKEARCLKL
tara:strand:+ start:4153 stop:4497 length:345 start_codon:yes stop_codon:yes gene_type:complete